MLRWARQRRRCAGRRSLAGLRSHGRDECLDYESQRDLRTNKTLQTNTQQREPIGEALSSLPRPLGSRKEQAWQGSGGTGSRALGRDRRPPTTTGRLPPDRFPTTSTECQPGPPVRTPRTSCATVRDRQPYPQTATCTTVPEGIPDYYLYYSTRVSQTATCTTVRSPTTTCTTVPEGSPRAARVRTCVPGGCGHRCGGT